MAEIIPEEFANKNKQELYADITLLSKYVTKLRDDIENNQAEMKLKNAEVTKLRGEILQLKSHIGHQNIQITNIQNDKDNIIDITYE
jgi:peptidoglycan hydrolase CwlO-like protein